MSPSAGDCCSSPALTAPRQLEICFFLQLMLLLSSVHVEARTMLDSFSIVREARNRPRTLSQYYQLCSALSLQACN